MVVGPAADFLLLSTGERGCKQFRERNRLGRLHVPTRKARSTGGGEQAFRLGVATPFARARNRAGRAGAKRV